MEIKNFMDYVSFSIKGLFLLLLALSGSYTKKHLGYNIEYILEKNMLVSNIFFFSLIYFAITITNINNDDIKMLNPLFVLKLTIYIYIFTLLLGRCEYYCTIIILMLLILCYLNYTFYRYYKKNKKYDEFRKLKKLQNILYFLIILILIIGFIIYFNKNFIRSSNKNKSLIKFFFGIPKR